jgi:histone-lysine N-methyltransferase SETD3
LVLEHEKGRASRWFPYLQLLPSFSSRDDVGSPLLFDKEEDVDALQDERMIKAARLERQRAKTAHGRFKRLFRSLVGYGSLELPRYVWARFLVNSRAFSIQGQRVLVPFGDIFNGEPDEEARAHDNGQRFLQFHDLQPEGMTIRADRGTPMGEQLFEDYGDNSNYVYFLHHGFLMRDRGFDCAAFRLPLLAEADDESGESAGVLASKSRILARVRVDDGPLACISRSGKLEDSGLVRIYTALYNMDAEQAAVCDDADAFSDCFPPELMPDFEAESGHELSLLLTAIRQQRERYSTSLAEDLASLSESSDVAASVSTKHALTFRLSRKTLLRDAQMVLEQHLQLVEEPDVVAIDEPGVGSSKLERFQQWIARHRFPVNHLELRYVSEAVGFGTFATEPLASGDVYLSVPVQAVMNVLSAVKSRWASQTMLALQKQRASVSREEMLLVLHLLEETFGPNQLQSRWKPYLDMLPVLDGEDGNSLGSPLFYEEDEEQLKALEGTDLLQLVVNYRQRVRQSYAALSDHFTRSTQDETLAWLTERRFRWANAVLDSRSIWWNSQRHLVPLLDMVNCQELHAEHKPHHTTLDSSGRHAVTKASWGFESGQEVVENYAQPNYIYLLYHGFVLDSNSHDCAHFHLELPASARQREFSGLLRGLEIYSWTPDVCVAPSDEHGVDRFAKIALLLSDPNEALRQLQSSPVSASSQAIAAAVQLVQQRLASLHSTSDADPSDFRTLSIRRYRQQQLRHLTELQHELQQQPK